MPDQETIEKAREDKREGKSPSTQAGEFVREEIHHVREGKHGARSTKQAIAIGLSEARRAGVKLSAPKKGASSPRVRKKAKQDLSKGKAGGTGQKSGSRSRAVSAALKQEGQSPASKKSLSLQARKSAKARGPSARHEAAMKAVRTKGKAGLKRAATKAARTRKRERHAA
jgi:Family of unknown function (DUF6496)